MSQDEAPRVLSIQSSVVSGYVGNRSATFPLQLLGYDVSCLNTVQFSVHTGYPFIRGSKLSGEEIGVLFEGLVRNRVDGFRGLVTGYVPGVEGVLAIDSLTKTLLAASSSTTTTTTTSFTRNGSGTEEAGNGFVWVLDPVMGDEERGLYVASDIPPLYRALVARASIITPNQFELGQLAEMSIERMQDVRLACRKLHRLGVDRIVVTTFRTTDDSWLLLRDPASSDAHRHDDKEGGGGEGEGIYVVGSSRVDVRTRQGDDEEHAMFYVKVPYHDRPYQGTGDLFAALLLGYTLRGQSLESAVTNVLDTMRPVIARTGRVFDRLLRDEKGKWKELKASGRGEEVCRACELRIVESAKDILSPEKFYTAISLPPMGDLKHD